MVTAPGLAAAVVLLAAPAAAAVVPPAAAAAVVLLAAGVAVLSPQAPKIRLLAKMIARPMVSFRLCISKSSSALFKLSTIQHPMLPHDESEVREPRPIAVWHGCFSWRD